MAAMMSCPRWARACRGDRHTYQKSEGPSDSRSCRGKSATRHLATERCSCRSRRFHMKQMNAGACNRENLQTNMFKYEQMNGVSPSVRPHEDSQPAASRATFAMMSCPRCVLACRGDRHEQLTSEEPSDSRSCLSKSANYRQATQRRSCHTRQSALDIMCAAPKFNTLKHEKMARAREHPNHYVERQTNEVCEPVVTNTRNFRLDGVGFSLLQSLIGGLLGQSRSTVERPQRHGHVQAEQLRVLMLVDIYREFVPHRKPKQRERCANGHDPIRRHLVFQEKMSTMASKPAYPKAAVELLRKSSRPQCRVPKQPEVAQPCQQLRYAAGLRPPRSKECHCSCEPNTRWAGRRAPEGSAQLLLSQHPQLTPSCPSHHFRRAHAIN